MPIFKVLILAIVQGLAELLPISSSAHVVVAEKLMGLDPSSPEMTLLLVMLHTGTMFAVIVYFWRRWSYTYFRSSQAFLTTLGRIALATLLTLAIGYPIKHVIEHHLFAGHNKGEIELLFSRLDLIAYALFAAGILILIAGLAERRNLAASGRVDGMQDRRRGGRDPMNITQAGIIGAVQGLALPFRGFSRSGTTISAGMLSGVPRDAAETFSFALAVVLTPAVVGYEALRLIKASHAASAAGLPMDLHASVVSSLIGMLFSFFAGLIALKWLSAWLEAGKWYLFGIYCLVASVVVYILFTKGY